MKNERIWSYVKETTSHLQNKLTKNIHLGVATRSSTKWDCLKAIRFHQYTWGLQHFLTFLQEDIGHFKCYWFKINYLFLSSFYIGNITFQIFDRNHIPSCTTAGSVLQLYCKWGVSLSEVTHSSNLSRCLQWLNVGGYLCVLLMY
jgi:hypothetical protein